MLKMIVGSTSSSNNIHKVVYDNSNRYRSMVIYVIELNHSYSCEGSHVDKEPNIDATRFLKFLKDSD
jgi:hypothetical protein